MGQIVLLDDATINKIAAGEVIERPASAVKEIMENSIDAGATSITVEIRNGGISYIRVTDNGKGIMPDDMVIAFERHATSKIRNADELEKVKTMGFRGEALASIASIAKVTLTSKVANEVMGHEVVIEGGQVLKNEEVGCSNGTSITIENLFYNTPVRYKFLKKDFTESGYIEDIVTRIALVHPEIAVKLINTEKTVIQTPGNGDIKTVIYNIYGKEIADNLIKVDFEYNDYKVTGVIGKPSISRANRAGQLFFVNNRYVKDKTLLSAAEQAFKNVITVGRHGFLVLNMTMDPSKVDVNVHPAKLEVRFQNENDVFHVIYHAIKNALEKDLNGETSENSIFENKEEPSLFDQKLQIIKNKMEEKRMQNSSDYNKYKIENVQEPVKVESFNQEISREVAKPEFNKIEESKPELISTKIDINVADTNKIEANNTVVNNQTTEMPKENISAEDKIVKEVIEQESEEKVEDDVKDFEKKNEEAFADVMSKLKSMQDMIHMVHTKLDEPVEPKKVEPVIQEQQPAVTNNYTEQPSSSVQEYIPKIDEKTIETIKPTTTYENSQVANNAYTVTNNQATNNISTFENKTQEPAKVENPTQSKIQISDNDFMKLYEKNFGIAVKKEDGADNAISEFKPVSYENVSMFNSNEICANKPVYKYIGLAFGQFINIEMNNDLYIISYKAMEEKIIYNKIKEALTSGDQDKKTSLMLLPDIIQLDYKQMGVFKDCKEFLADVGLIAEEFGENTVKLSSVPEIIMEYDTKKLFIEILDEINKVARNDKQEIELKIIETIAKKAAEKTKVPEGEEKIKSILDKFLSMPNPFVNFDGEALAIKMTKYDIEKKFSRIQ